MPFNLPGVLACFQLVINPRLALPGLVVKDIRQIDFYALREHGYRGAVFDKDNCLTLPHKDTLVPELQEAWRECREVFGEGNVLIVSNTAGTSSDAGDIQAESVTYHLSVPVLRHTTLKPGYACAAGVRAYFASLPAPVAPAELVVVGDRVLTDVVLANRMAPQRRGAPEVQRGRGAPLGPGPLAVWTTGVWRREGMLMRWAERGLVRAVERWTGPRWEGADAAEVARFVKRGGRATAR